MSEVFISYSWDSPEHEQKVLQFTDYLRKKGFEAELDKMLNQKETATNFIKMMHSAMLRYPKVIVILSEGYKAKAEAFTGGVGEEYQLLINDIKTSPNKYILLSFNGRSNEIVPFGLIGRDIIDLSQSGEEERLYRKLMDVDAFAFSPVASEKPHLDSTKIDTFQAVSTTNSISIETPFVKIDNSSAFGGLYRYIEFKLVLNFKNISNHPISDFAYDLKLKQQLYPSAYGSPSVDGYYILSESIDKKLFPNQIVKSKEYEIKIADHTKHQILGTLLTITVYTDQETTTKEFEINELFKVLPPNKNYGDPAPLDLEIFL